MIREEYERTEISLSDLADKHGIKYPTIKSRKQRQAWEKDASIDAKDASATKEDASTRSRAGPPKGNRNAVGSGAPKGNKNAVGNSGGAAPMRNLNAVTHGFFRKFFPEETLEIMEQIETRSPLDMLWDNIVIQYTAIIRAQQIMFVRDQEDETKVLKKFKPGMFGDEKEWEYQHAWDKQATFLQAQSRAMATFQSLIRQYEELCNKGLATEEQRLRVEKLKLEVGNLRGDTDGDAHQQNSGYAAALNAQAADVFADEVNEDGEEA
ncbi:hypothetical protein JNE38_16585 [Brevibacillus choshinensis]|uniref:Terminase n=1 Tax=Brevibacillus choshinensis TaxID=54911 RepID=A0ABX7FXU8_BRECH|nr:hypothetical protein JNE38_16585 [Brevibacillus choshinensis]